MALKSFGFMKYFLVLLLSFGAFKSVIAQNQARIIAKVLDSKTLKPLVGVVVSIQNTS